jgi:cobalt-zinc-cadmium efflux system membrane fusion protein
MTSDARFTLRKGAAALAAVALLAVGAGATYLLMRSDAGANGHGAAMPPPAGVQRSSAATAAATKGPLSDVVVPLSQDAAERAGIVVAPVASEVSGTELRLPGVVEPNAYRQIVVTPLVAGRVTKVGPALGDRVRRGETLVEIYSPALAEAQTRYVSAQAMLDAHDRELQRTQKLVEIGAASRQELEKIHAEHAAQTAAAQSARSQLELLGVSTSALEKMSPDHNVSATISVPAPIDGVVTERGANVGLNADQATKLFTVVDLSTVWVVANLYEKDFSRVRVGAEAAITTSARPDVTLRGRVSYIDPQVSPDTRTAKVRIEVPNPSGELRLGMYADVVVAGAPGPSAPRVPRHAVQNVGDRTVVYLANPQDPGKFTEREVRLGQASGQQVEVVSGVQPGDFVVTEGSFFVRAERERLGLRPAATRGD